MPLISSYDFVLLDTSPVINFCDANKHLKLVDYLWSNGHFTTFVQDELNRKAANHRNVHAFLDAWPSDGILSPDASEAIEIDQLLRLGAKNVHPLEDAGEISTVIVAASYQRDQSVVVIDDTWGKSLARQWGVPCGITPDLIVEMVWAHVLSEDEGRAVWNVALTRPEAQFAYPERLARALERLGARPAPPSDIDDA